MRLTVETSETLDPSTYAALRSAISSLESVFGPTPCELRVGRTIAPYGQDLAPASLSARQAKDLGLLTSGTYGQAGTGSLSSVALTRFLASKLQVRTATLGSTLFRLTWKEVRTPLGRTLPLLRASAPRTAGTGYTSWPTPKVGTGGSAQGYGKASRANKSRIEDVAQLAAWPTPMALAHWPTTTVADSKASRSLGYNGQNFMTLTDAARLAGWSTPTSRDHKDGSSTLENTPINGLLGRQVRLADSGQTPNGFRAQTGRPAPLNPEHSRSLMTLPAVWTSCAPTATRSSRTKRSPS